LLSLIAFKRLYVIPFLDRKHRSNDLADGRYLDTLTWICWFAMSISGIIWLLAVVASMTSSEIELAAVAEVVGITQFGHLWLFRSLLALAMAGGLLYNVVRKTSRADSNVLCIVLAAVSLASLAGAGHAGAGTGSFANFHLLTDLVHLLASALWPGGLLPLAVWFLVNARGRGNQLVNYAVIYRFSAISLVAVVLLAVSGLLNSLFMIKRLSDFSATTYGQILAVKIILFLTMIGVGAQNRRLLRTQRQSKAQRIDQSSLAQLFRNIWVESALAIIVFGLAGALGTIEPPGISN
jgi:putative copper resistance protein D